MNLFSSHCQSGSPGRLARPDQVSPGDSGFTLIEMMMATVIMAIILAAVYSTWSGSLMALKRSRDLTENLQRQRALTDILTRSFRSAIFSQENATWYAWTTQDRGTEDLVSFVTTEVPTIGGSTPMANMTQRVELSYEPDETNTMVLMARVKNFLASDLDEAGQTVRLADWVRSFNLRYYDADNDQWLDEWEKTDDMPHRVELTLTMASSNPTQPDVVCTKIIEIPSNAAAQIGAQVMGTSAGTSGTNRTPASPIPPPGGGGSGGGTPKPPSGSSGTGS